MPTRRFFALLLAVLVMVLTLTFAQQPTRKSPPLAKSAEQKAKQGDAKEKTAPADKEADKAKATPDKKPAPRDPEIQALILDAYLCPPEFAANALIRIAQSSRMQDKEWKREILEEAFNLASGAQESMKRVAMHVDGTTDTRPRMMTNGFAMGLDALSLRCQVVKQMLTVEKEKAIELFKRIDSPKVNPSECEEIFIAEPSAYYQTLGEIAKAAFTPKEIAANAVVTFVLPSIYRMHSPAQVNGVAELLATLPVTNSQFGTLIRDFSAALEKVAGNDNAFSETAVLVYAGIVSLLNECKKRDLSRDDLLLAYRSYLIKNLSGIRCARNAGSKTPRRMDRLSGMVQIFNEKLRFDNAPSQREILPIASEDIEPAEVRGFCEETRFWTTREASDFMAKFKALRFSGSILKSEAEKESPDWQMEFQKYLGELVAWEGKDEKSDAEVFHQKVLLLMGLTEDAPNDKLRETAFREMVRLLNSSLLYQDSRSEWFVIADSMIRRFHDKGRATIFTELKESRNPVLSLYARLEEIAPRKSR